MALQVPYRISTQVIASQPSLARRASIASVTFSLVLPTYNESNTIAAVVAELCSILDSLLPQDYELIVVDDDSPDRTWAIAQDLRKQYPQLRAIRRQQERGLATAVIRGWQEASGEILGVMDADLQHPPETIAQLLQAIASGADLAVASRHWEGGGVSDWSFTRRFLSRGAQLLGLVLLPGTVGRVSDPMSGYFAIRRSAIGDRDLRPVGYKILIEVLARGTIGPLAEVGYVFQERAEGESKVTWKQYRDYLRHLLRLRLDLWPFGRFFRFGLVGLSGVFVDMTVLYLLSDPSTLGWGLTRSKAIAAELAIINNFIWNDRWTFADISNRQRGWKKRFKRLIKFNLICLVGLVINIIVLNVMFNLFLPNRYVANAIAIGAATLWNFWINLKLSWRTTETK